MKGRGVSFNPLWLLLVTIILGVFALILLAICDYLMGQDPPDSEDYAEIQERNTSIVCWFANWLSSITNTTDTSQGDITVQWYQNAGSNTRHC